LVKRSKSNKLENWEIALIKAMISSGKYNDQTILSYFTRPSRSINHARISEIRNGEKHTRIKAANDDALECFLSNWPQIDWKTGLHIHGDELIIKAREAMVLAVQSYNNPNTYFRSEVFIVTAIIAWTYLLHYYYKRNGVDYRHKINEQGVSVVAKTKNGAEKYWELEKCLNVVECPLDEGTKTNLKFLIQIRHEIEHRMTNQIDDALSAKLQACCMNFNREIKNIFGKEYGLDNELSIALQFSGISNNQAKSMSNNSGDLPNHIEAVRKNFEDGLTEEQYNDPHYAYRVLFVPKTVNKKAQADEVIEFIAADTDESKKINSVYLKEVDKIRLRPGTIVKKMQDEGFVNFKMTDHTRLWQKLDAKNTGKGYGIETESDGWRWYERWLEAVRQHCEENRESYT